jgi:hypothetical protein
MKIFKVFFGAIASFACEIKSSQANTTSTIMVMFMTVRHNLCRELVF